MERNETINILKKIYIWDLILFVPGALLFSYLPLNNLLDMIINVVIFIFFTIGVFYTVISIRKRIKK